MKKTFIFSFVIILFSSICFAVPNPGGKAKIRNGLPSGVTPPATIYKTSNIKNPLPTNKWFNSILHNQYNDYSFKMFTYPQNVECVPNEGQSKGLLISYPKTKYLSDVISYGYSGDTTYNYEYPNNIKVSEYSSIADGSYVNFGSAKLDKYSDFSATAKWEESSYWMKATFGQGFVFSYFECDNAGYPAIEFPYEWERYGRIRLYKPNDTTPIPYDINIDTGNSDRIILETKFEDGRSVFYGIFVPVGTTFKQASWGDNFNRIFIVLPSNERFFSIGLLPATNINDATTDLDLYYKYAYNFVTDTKVNWNVSLSDFSSQTTFSITTTKKRTDIVGQQDGTLFCLLPHQYNNLYSSTDFVGNKTFDTLRGTLKLAKGNTFSTKTVFNGIVPFFNYDVTNIKTTLSEYIKVDNDSTPVNSVPTNTYHGGKVLAKLANMLPIADNLNDTVIKKSIIIKLKNLLSTWFTYNSQNNKYFAYDNIWGGLIGIENSYGSEQYNDHHFHYGYFIYTAAILAMYDDTFVQDYGGMVDLLIKDIANTKRNDSDFPYMRCFDFYESHSWANGMGGADNRGIDQESSSEAMNAWSAIYLWGLATDNDEYKKLGIFLYSSEYEAVKQYYFDINGDVLKVPYNHNSVGILWGGQVIYDLHFTDYDDQGQPLPYKRPQKLKGIQVLPVTPAMTYLAYDKTYIRDFYTECLGESHSDKSCWYDIWARLVALYDPATALSNFNTYKQVTAEEGSSMSFTYHFIKFFENYGSPVFGKYTADTPSYIVLEKGDTTTWCAYNPEKTSKNVKFYNSSGEFLGYLYVPKQSFALTQQLSKVIPSEKISVYPVPYKPNSGGRYGGDGIHFTNVTEGTNIKIFNVAGEKVFEQTLDSSDDFLWNAKNNAGNNIASGIYFYYIKTPDGKKVKGKLAVER
ncbi:MAG: gliding motility-associated C-terminal domain-containing protein [Endomicrobiaceae bacterium]|nr:gliding motility-associated C-terminal domain-containing protein [Endomicrobiaceae bacterium]